MWRENPAGEKCAKMYTTGNLKKHRHSRQRLQFEEIEQQEEGKAAEKANKSSRSGQSGFWRTSGCIYFIVQLSVYMQGFWYRKLCLAFKKFSKKHKETFSKFKTSLRQHIAEGICLPACTMRHLTNNVTKRRSSGIMDMPCSTIS